MHHVAFASLLALAAVALSSAAQQPPPPQPSVKVGQPAPAFSLPYFARSQDGTFSQASLSLADFKGKKTVILAFFPAAFSPG